MKDSKREPLLEQLAKQYIDEDGRRLAKEAEVLEENASIPLPEMDGKVRGFRAARRQGRYVAAFSAVAAGLLLIFLLPRLEVLSPASDAPIVTHADDSAAMHDIYTTPLPEANAFIAESDAMPEEAADAVGGAAPDTPVMEDAAPEAAVQAPDTAPKAAASDIAPDAEAAAPAPPQDTLSYYASEEAETAAAPAPAIIPLSFAMPAGFTVDSVRQDEGETIYRLANAALDDVVLSVEDAATAPLSTGGLVAVDGEAGETAYGLAGADAQFLTFEQDGLRYRLTCQHDIQTLLSLWQHIIAA